ICASSFVSPVCGTRTSDSGVTFGVESADRSLFEPLCPHPASTKQKGRIRYLVFILSRFTIHYASTRRVDASMERVLEETSEKYAPLHPKNALARIYWIMYFCRTYPYEHPDLIWPV